jgi:hypothetical protein
MLERAVEAFEDLVRGKKSLDRYVLLPGGVAKQTPTGRL